MLDIEFLRSDLFLLTLTVGLYCVGWYKNNLLSLYTIFKKRI